MFAVLKLITNLKIVIMKKFIQIILNTKFSKGKASTGKAYKKAKTKAKRIRKRK